MKTYLKCKPLLYQTIIKYLLAFILFTLLNFSFKKGIPLSIAGFNALAITTLNPIILLPFSTISTFLFFGHKLTISVLISNLISTLVFSLYKARKIRPKFELFIYVPTSLIHYIFFYSDDIYLALIGTLIITIFTFALLSCIDFLTVKGIKYQPTIDEFIMLSIVIAVLELGLINFTHPKVIWILFIFSTLFLTRIFSNATPFILAVVFSLPFSIYHLDFNYVGMGVALALISYTLTPLSPFVAGLGVSATDYILNMIFNVYNGYDVYDFCMLAGVILVYFLFPESIFVRIREEFNQGRDKILAKETINVAHANVRDKLFDLSTVFQEISLAFNELKKREICEEEVVDAIVYKTYEDICKNCERKCNDTNSLCNDENQVLLELKKTVKIGVAKGKISFIDLPLSFNEHCYNSNAVIFSINKDLSEYRKTLIENANFSLSRELIAEQSEGISKMLKTLAVTSTKELDYKTTLEEKIRFSLRKKGIAPLEILTYKTDSDTEISLILKHEEYLQSKIEKSIFDAIGEKLKVSTISEISPEKTFVLLEKPTNYKAIYAVNTKRKSTSEKSGDTHSEIMLSKDTLMVALSDGMGSGEKAENLSSITLSLIESLYKAGLTSDTILPLVNKILAINTEDSFSALDLCSINLNTLKADFIKFGAPRGFLLSESGIKIIESNTLPIGIIKELEPSIVTTTLSENEIMLFMSDGVADAFNSSSEIIDYLKSAPIYNPTELVDGIMDKAVSLYKNVLIDDMTVLAVRVLKNKIS